MVEAEAWLKAAQEALDDAEFALNRQRYNKVAFWSQQAVEYSLKAAILFFKRKHARGHNLPLLFKIVQKEVNLAKDHAGKLGNLTVDYTRSRYVDITGITPSSAYLLEEAERKFQVASEVVKRIETAIRCA